jgi:hypothetical protein
MTGTDTNATAQAPDDGVMGMGEAPERIWAASATDDGWSWPVASKFPMQGYAPDSQVSYVRADIHANTLAALDRAEADKAAAVDATLDAAHEYLVSVYGHSPLAHPIDRARINAIRTVAKP